MNENQPAEATMDPNTLFLEETFTDQKAGTIRRMTPVDADGNKDDSKPVLFYGQAQMLTPAGALPLNFQLEADNLAQAAEQFSTAAKKAMEQTLEELKEYRRQSASSIVLPGQGGGIPPGGDLPGGGKIQL